MQQKKNTKYYLLLLFCGVVVLGTSIYWTMSDGDKKQKLFNAHYKIFPIHLPQNAHFGNEKVPIDDYDVAERLDRELLINTYWQSNTLLLLKRANRWFPVMEKILAKHNVPDDFKYVCAIESGFINVVSPAGATGFWQIMEKTGKELGLEINKEVDERYDPIKSTDAACKYFKTAYKMFGSWTDAAASYNIGMRGLSRALKAQNAKSYYDLMLNSETARYVFRIIAFKELYLNPQKYGFVIEEDDLYKPVKTSIITVDTTINNLADFASQFHINYKYLKISNPWLRKNKLTVSAGNSYKILIPKSKPEFSPYLDSWIDSLIDVKPDTSMLKDSLGGDKEISE